MQIPIVVEIKCRSRYDLLTMISPQSNIVIIATHNAHKISEIQLLLGPGFSCIGIDRNECDVRIVEDAESFAGNATKKALGFGQWITSRPDRLESKARRTFVVADDSGLEVDALNGAPGVHSARFAALDDGRPGNSTDSENNAKLLRLLSNVSQADRTARFRCVLALVEILKSGGMTSPQLFDGTCEGHIIVKPRGLNGFGYDPLFVPAGLKKSFAELDEASKNKISHRAKAVEKLKAALSAMP